MYSRWNAKAFTILLAALVLAGMGKGAASAAACLDEVSRLSDRYHLSSDPPDAPSSKAPGPVRPGDLARSGGVIQPAPTPDRAVITPPRAARDDMPTVPDIKEPPKKQEDAASGKLDAADMTRLQSLLVAARAQAKRGAEAECMDRLREALELIARPKQ